MINDIRQYTLSYELWKFTSQNIETLFYKEYINQEFMRFASVDGNTFEVSEVDVSNSVLVDASEGLIPEWIINYD